MSQVQQQQVTQRAVKSRINGKTSIAKADWRIEAALCARVASGGV
jgi:hypothetical protein